MQLRGVGCFCALVLAHVLFQLADLVAARREDIVSVTPLPPPFKRVWNVVSTLSIPAPLSLMLQACAAAHSASRAGQRMTAGI